MRHRLCECLGLSENEAKVYIALISAGVANARTLSVMSDVPRTNVYSALNRLAETGLITEIPEEPKKRWSLLKDFKTFSTEIVVVFSVILSMATAFWIVGLDLEFVDRILKMTITIAFFGLILFIVVCFAVMFALQKLLALIES